VKKLLLLALLAAIATLVMKALQFMKEWEGLPESELRARIEEKLSSRVSPEQLTEITNAVVDMMRQRGKLGGEAPAGA
jgi:predicted nucleic acid-binding protein